MQLGGAVGGGASGDAEIKVLLALLSVCFVVVFAVGVVVVGGGGGVVGIATVGVTFAVVATVGVAFALLMLLSHCNNEYLVLFQPL